MKQQLTLRSSLDGTLLAKFEGEPTFTAVSVKRCFPWLNPSQFISLRDEENDEFALVEDIQTLDPESQRHLIDKLDTSNFTLEIEKIENIELDFELRNWTVFTCGARRNFQTELDTWPTELADGSILIQDISGDLYKISEPTQLDTKSQEHLWAFIS